MDTGALVQELRKLEMYAPSSMVQKTPFILHPNNDTEGSYRFVGECHVLGLMHGEVMDMLEEDTAKEEILTLY